MILEFAALQECRDQYYTHWTLSLSQLPRIARWNSCARSRTLLSEMKGEIFYTIPHFNHPESDAVCKFRLAPGQYNQD